MENLTMLQLIAIIAEAGCSLQTGRRAYAGKRVNDYNRARIVKAARALGYPTPPESASVAKGCAA